MRELRLIQELEPRFNRQGKRWRATAYVKLTLTERFPRLTVVRTVKPDGNLYLGPFPSTRAAHTVREAIETAAPLRRCTVRTGRTKTITPDAPCAPAQLGVAVLPVPRPHERRGLRRGRRHGPPRAHRRTRAGCSIPSSDGCARSRRRSASKRPR